MQALLAYWVLYSLVSEYFSYLGTHHQVQVEVCSCSSVPVTLVHHRLWPATPSRPGLAFHFDLMEAMESLLLECQVAAKDFCAALSSRLPFLYRRVVSVFYYFLFGFFLLLLQAMWRGRMKLRSAIFLSVRGQTKAWSDDFKLKQGNHGQNVENGKRHLRVLCC